MTLKPISKPISKPSSKPVAKASAASKAKTIGSPSHELRIIGGLWKRSKIKVIDKPGLRPTPDRVRETLFNWLGQDLTGWKCVDAFAGTGALGFEAASRGAQQVDMMEQDAQLAKLLEATQQRLTPGHFDLIFLDPPFEATYFQKAVKAAALAVAPGAWVYLEAPQKWDAEALHDSGLVLVKYLKAGAVHAHLLQRPLE